MAETDAAALHAILQLLERVDRRIDEMEKNSRLSRGRIHERLDEQAKAISEVREDIAIAATVSGQQREAMKDLDDKIGKMQPDVDQWRQIRKLGYGFSGLLVALGMTGAGLLIYLGETARAVARKWLGIG